MRHSKGRGRAHPDTQPEPSGQVWGLRRAHTGLVRHGCTRSKEGGESPGAVKLWAVGIQQGWSDTLSLFQGEMEAAPTAV